MCCFWNSSFLPYFTCSQILTLAQNWSSTHYKIISITYKTLLSHKPSYSCTMFSISIQTLALVLLPLSLSNAPQSTQNKWNEMNEVNEMVWLRMIQRKWMWDGSPEARSKEPDKWRKCVKHAKEKMIGLEWNWDVDRSRSRGVETNWRSWEKWIAGWRNTFERAFQRTGAWQVNDLSVILLQP